ncbi:hypothetical protein [Companilactobacillus mishanensis]|uniref:Lipoprotein n=1 Tax=Companilactobacillus mishanensis TaxID=2486008 RepID=A0A5P0ZHN0_9LACO|nr:hypothetical protein [Companilactobacillus mishanensis]MQS52577.1 hypothetical protein [Companilactobacillus mishanensis]
MNKIFKAGMVAGSVATFFVLAGCGSQSLEKQDPAWSMSTKVDDNHDEKVKEIKLADKGSLHKKKNKESKIKIKSLSEAKSLVSNVVGMSTENNEAYTGAKKGSKYYVYIGQASVSEPYVVKKNGDIVDKNNVLKYTFAQASVATVTNPDGWGK